MAVNQKLENTSNSSSLSIHPPRVGRSAMYWATFWAFRLRWGIRAPGIAASASRNSSTSAVRIEVRLRHALRAPAMMRLIGEGRFGAVGRVGCCAVRVISGAPCW